MNKIKNSPKRLHCPVCDSSEIYTIVGGYTGNAYKCKKCGYQGALVIEHEENLNDEFEEALNYDENTDSDAKTKSPILTITRILLLILLILFILSIIAIYLGVIF